MTLYFTTLMLGILCLGTALYIEPPDLCEDGSIDTITTTQDSSTYVFKGDFYWRVIHNVTSVGYPQRISDDWGGLEGNLDASFTNRGGSTYFFKGSRFWKFRNRVKFSGYPKRISERFRGIPDHLDAALFWSGDNKIYFFKGDKYWLYGFRGSTAASPAYQSSITDWRGLPEDGIDAAFVWENKVSYFFKGRLYYRFDDTTLNVSTTRDYPRSTAYAWFSCAIARR